MRVRQAFFCSSSDLVIGGQSRSLWRLGMSLAHIGFDVVGALGEEPPEEVEGSGLGGGDKEVEIDLDDKLGSLLDSLNA